MSDPERGPTANPGDPEEARRYFEKGYAAQMQNRLDEAVACYRRSIAIRPTAEAHTFLGWVFSFQGRHDDAITQCKIAIQVDPDFGNPYNDIGAYLIELGNLDEAIPWLERAKDAPRYDPRHFPYLNLGRIYQKQGKVMRAITELEAALEIAPRDPVAREVLSKLRRLN